MSVLSDSRLRWLVLAIGLVTLAAVGVVGVGTVALLSALASVAPGEFVLVALLEAALPYLLGVVALGLVDVALVTWLVARAVRLAELPRSERLARVAAFAERRVPVLEAFGVADSLSPTAADRREALKERYARGELDEAAFEREMAALLAEENDDVDRATAADAMADRVDAERTPDAEGSTTAREPAVDRERP